MGPRYVLQLLKIRKLLITPQPLKLEKLSTCLESLESYRFFDACLTKFENYLILLKKTSHRLLVTTKLFCGGKNLIGQLKVS
jgi:hypothetical protein